MSSSRFEVAEAGIQVDAAKLLHARAGVGEAVHSLEDLSTVEETVQENWKAGEFEAKLGRPRCSNANVWDIERTHVAIIMERPC